MKKVIPEGLTGKELLDFIVKNENLIVHAKKSETKKCDAVQTVNLSVNDKGDLTSKMFGESVAIPETANRIKLDVVINTTNYFDSHMDVHIPGLWNKSLSDNNKAGFYLLKRHRDDFEDVIGEGMKGTAKKISWLELGFNYSGITEALMFSGEIEKERNPYMFDQYRKGYVKQHSVGMRYMKMVTCINDDDYPVQKENWDKYFPMVINRDECEKAGVFWAVLEAKVVEGSAVLFASNNLTPTHSMSDASTKNEPLISTQEQPQNKAFDLEKAIKQTVFII